jgi:hypothetical protein
MKGGAWTTRPVSILAGLVTFETVAPPLGRRRFPVVEFLFIEGDPLDEAAQTPVAAMAAGGNTLATKLLHLCQEEPCATVLTQYGDERWIDVCY